jgi:hypothetical protein
MIIINQRSWYYYESFKSRVLTRLLLWYSQSVEMQGLPNAPNILGDRMFMIAYIKYIHIPNIFIGKCGSIFASECAAEQALKGNTSKGPKPM